MHRCLKHQPRAHCKLYHLRPAAQSSNRCPSCVGPSLTWGGQVITDHRLHSGAALHLAGAAAGAAVAAALHVQAAALALRHGLRKRDGTCGLVTLRDG